MTAARLYGRAKAVPRNSRSQFKADVDALQVEIEACGINVEESFVLKSACGVGDIESLPNRYYCEGISRQVAIVAEIFRHALHIYVHRIENPFGNALSLEMQHTVHVILELLPQVPDAIGVGGNLGWALMVVGSELNDPQERDYISQRWQMLHLLGMESSRGAEKDLHEIWRLRDVSQTTHSIPQSWQEVMCSNGEKQMLI